MNGLFFIGDLRRKLFIGRSSWWNALIRDVTAKYERTWLIRDSR